MKMSETIEEFITMVEANAHVEAVERFYAEHAILQDNQSADIRGKKEQLETEKALLSKVKKMRSQCVRPYLMKDNLVVIKWLFRFEFKNDTFMDVEEISYQQWDKGQIVKEQFFFDPKQFIPKSLN